MAAVLGGWLWPALVRAQTQIVLATHVRADAGVGEQELVGRVRQELVARGFQVSTVSAPRDLALEQLAPWLAEQVRAREAVVGVAVSVEAQRARLWVIDRATAKRLWREVDLAPPIASTLALAAAELVEASLLELFVEHETVQPEVEVDPGSLPVMPPHRPDPPPPPRWRIGAGVGGMWATRLSAPTATAHAHADVRAGRRVWLGVTSTLALHGHGTTGSGVAVRTFAFAYGLHGAVDVLPHRAPLDLELVAGVEAGALRVLVEREPELVRTLWTPLFGGGLGLRRDFTHWYVGVRARVDVPGVGVRLHVHGVLAQDWGGPWVRAWAFAGARW